ncbi:MAG: cyclic nucleotide-binding domain-containing protein [Chloroflexi bacterium]|nr:MAG: cyclic nucleotide-binding domain-containing protein [Chloroflexota bacterium]TMG21243.1 MAG: cyclic nucleotide-binding domain-containing protein [Chloroflexota bacterium]TMG64961.1 MAG: cyclic nucleotide-binding domain-containing protein [Chloroflexota bacterium]
MSPRAHPGGWETPAPGRPVLARGEHRDAPSKRRDRPSPSFHDMVSRLSALESAPVFFGLPDATLRTLARRLRRIKVSAGDMIVFQGEPGDTIFIIERGRFRIVIEKPPSIVTVALLSEGDFFGEGAAVLNRSQQASVYAQTDGYLLALDKQALHSTMAGREHPALEELRQVADRRFRAFADTSVQATWGLLLQEATVVGVYSPKGGSGGTCISLNLVGALARRYPGEVLLLDLDFPYSHSALLAGLVPTSCLARMSSLPQESFEEVLLSAILYHPGGPMILPGALRPEEADEVTPELITRAISVLRKSFTYIVVDLGVTITDATLALFDLTQHVVVVAAPELSSVKSAADAMDILGQLGTPHDRLSLVLNNRSFKPAVTRSAVERTLKREVDIEIEFDGARPEQAAVDGAILSITNPRSEIAKGCEALAALLDSKHGRQGLKLSAASAESQSTAGGVGEAD